MMGKVNTIRNIVHRNIERQLVREYLLKETERAGFGGLEFNRTPDGTKVTPVSYTHLTLPTKA